MQQKIDTYNGILCPSCNYGIISTFHPSASLFTYNDGTTRISLNAHMTCPYCGCKSLVSNNGEQIFYGADIRKDGTTTTITVVDL